MSYFLVFEHETDGNRAIVQMYFKVYSIRTHIIVHESEIDFQDILVKLFVAIALQQPQIQKDCFITTSNIKRLLKCCFPFPQHYGFNRRKFVHNKSAFLRV